MNRLNFKLFIICMVPLFMAVIMRIIPKTIRITHGKQISTMTFKNSMYTGYANYKKRSSYLPTNISKTSKSLEEFGTVGEPYTLCGQPIPNIDDSVTKEELVFLYRKNNPQLNISINNFMSNEDQPAKKGLPVLSEKQKN